MSLSRLNALLSRGALVRKHIAREEMRQAPRTLELIRLKALLLKLQPQISVAMFGENVWNNRRPALARAAGRPDSERYQLRRVA